MSPKIKEKHAKNPTKKKIYKLIHTAFFFKADLLHCDRVLNQHSVKRGIVLTYVFSNPMS